MNNIKDRYNKSKIFFSVLIINLFLSFTINNRNKVIKIDVYDFKIIYKMIFFVILILPTVYFLFSLLKIKNNKISTYLKNIKKCFIEIIISIISFSCGIYFLIAFKRTYWFFNIPLISTIIIYLFSSVIEISINKYNINQMFWGYKIYFKPIVEKSAINKNSKKESIISSMVGFVIISFWMGILMWLPLGYFINFSNRRFFIGCLIIFIYLNRGYILDLFSNQYTKIEGVCTDKITDPKSRYTGYVVTDYRNERTITISAPIKTYEFGDRITVIHAVFNGSFFNFLV